MRMGQFDYPLPPEAIAQQPVEPRDAARLLVAGAGGVEHRRVRDLPELLRPGDVLVVNETRVLPARLPLRKATGGAVEVLFLEPRESGGWEALVRPGRRVAEGLALPLGDEASVVIGAPLGDGRRAVSMYAGGRPLAVDEVLDVLERHGVLPLPPYVTTPLAEPSRYQTVFARHPASVAAPTAGLHLTPDVLDRCRARGIEVATVDLAVGIDTFRPITVDDPADHLMHSERYRVPDATWAACAAADRVVAVGTTTVRALESAARGPHEGRTDLFIRRGFDFRVVDVLLTNFHLPRSSLLLIVDAFIGDRWRQLYDIALAEGYRFLSLGDAMLLERARRP